MKQVTLYTGNHQPTVGILDYIDILKFIFKRRGEHLTVSDTLDTHGVNLIIDEFSSYYTIRHLEETKQEHPDMRLVYILTEFVTPTAFFTTFNYFNGRVKWAFLPWYHIRVCRKRPEFGVTPNGRDYFNAFLTLPTLGLVGGYYLALRLLGRLHLGFAQRRLKRFRKTVGNAAYLHRRFLGLQKMIAYADAVAIIHPKLMESAEYLKAQCGKENMKVFDLYPELDDGLYAASGKGLKTFLEREMGIEQSGSITPYRHSFTILINAMIAENFRFNAVCEHSFSDSGKENQIAYAYSLHPPQSKDWRFSSPTRIYRGLIQGSVPILTKVFDDHPIEQVALHFEANCDFLFRLEDMQRNRNRLSSYLNPRISKYNQFVRPKNDVFIEGILRLA